MRQTPAEIPQAMDGIADVTAIITGTRNMLIEQGWTQDNAERMVIVLISQSMGSNGKGNA